MYNLPLPPGPRPVRALNLSVTITGTKPLAEFGESLAVFNSVHNNQTVSIAVGAPAEGTGRQGAVYVLPFFVFFYACKGRWVGYSVGLRV